MKRIYAAANLQDAHILAHSLQAAGIECHIFNENMQSGVGEIPFVQAYPEIWIVQEADEPQARAMIREFERAGDEPLPRCCPHCGEECPGNFQQCWHCRRPLD